MTISNVAPASIRTVRAPAASVSVSTAARIRAPEFGLRDRDPALTGRRIGEVHPDQDVRSPAQPTFGRANAHRADGHDRKLRCRLLPDLGHRNSDGGIGSLQAAVVQERDLNGNVCGEVRQQAAIAEGNAPATNIPMVMNSPAPLTRVPSLRDRHSDVRPVPGPRSDRQGRGTEELGPAPRGGGQTARSRRSASPAHPRRDERRGWSCRFFEPAGTIVHVVGGAVGLRGAVCGNGA